MREKVAHLTLPPPTRKNRITPLKGLRNQGDRSPASRIKNYWFLQPEEEGQGLTVLITSGQGSVFL